MPLDAAGLDEEVQSVVPAALPEARPSMPEDPGLMLCTDDASRSSAEPFAWLPFNRGDVAGRFKPWKNFTLSCEGPEVPNTLAGVTSGS